MTGLFVRIKRDDGSIQNVEFDQMTDAEMDRLSDCETGDGWRYAIALVKWIREHVKEADDSTHVSTS